MKRGLSIVLTLAMIFSSLAFVSPEARSESRRILDCHYSCHRHTESCYTDGVLTCGQVEGCLHIHTGDCYDENGTLVCPLTERTHTHSDDCYDEGGNLICEFAGMPEHVHGENCFYYIELTPEPIPEPEESPAPADDGGIPPVATEDTVSEVSEETEPAVTEETVPAAAPEDTSPAVNEDIPSATPENTETAATEDNAPAVSEDSPPALTEDPTPAATEDTIPEMTEMTENPAPTAAEETVPEAAEARLSDAAAKDESTPIAGTVSDGNDANPDGDEESPAGIIENSPDTDEDSASDPAGEEAGNENTGDMSQTGNDPDNTDGSEKTVGSEEIKDFNDFNESDQTTFPDGNEEPNGTDGTGENVIPDNNDEPVKEISNAENNGGTGETEGNGLTDNSETDKSETDNGTEDGLPPEETRNPDETAETDETVEADPVLPTAMIPAHIAQQEEPGEKNPEDSSSQETENSGAETSEEEPSSSTAAVEMVMVSPNLSGIEGVANPELTEIELSIDTMLDAGAIEALILNASASNKSYNAKELGLLPSIRNQYPYGACWAFATIGAIEADLILSNRSLVNTIDFSELHLAWFAMHTFTDVKGNNADTVTSMGLAYLDNGGYDAMAYLTLANLLGLVNEKDAPYNSAKTYNPGPDGRSQNAATLVAAYEISISDSKAIKQAILEHGGVAASMYAPDDETPYFNAAYACFYYPYEMNPRNYVQPNHAIMLVGWDDDFSASRFKTNPGQNGAWLVRNSWGGSNTEYTYDGYFWMSYADKGLIAGKTVTAYDAEMGATYDYVYAYDNDPLITKNTGGSTKLEVISIFPVEAGDTIESVGFGVLASNATATVRLDAGERYITATRNVPTDGFYIVSLPAGLKIRTPTDVKITLTLESKNEIYFCCEDAGSYDYGNVRFTAVSTGNGFDVNGYHYSNDPRLRLYATKTIDSSDVLTNQVTISKNSLSLLIKETAQLTAEAFPTWADHRGITWNSSSTAIATVDQDGSITAVSEGTVDIIAAAVDGGSRAVCTLEVIDPVKDFVRRLYRICLGREPDPNGFDHWVNALRDGSMDGANLAASFYNSDEMTKSGISNSEYVERAYLGFMGRNSDAAGKAHWVELLNNGASYGRIIEGFSQSQEFGDLCSKYGINRGTYTSTEARDKNDGITAFTSRLYTEALGRNYDVAGLNAWCQTILNNLTRDTILNVALTGFLHSEEFVGKNLSDTDYIDVMYRTFLDRLFDENGLAYWIGQLVGGMTRDWVAQQFANSQEFSDIMSAFGL